MHKIFNEHMYLNRIYRSVLQVNDMVHAPNITTKNGIFIVSNASCFEYERKASSWSVLKPDKTTIRHCRLNRKHVQIRTDRHKHTAQPKNVKEKNVLENCLPLVGVMLWLLLLLQQLLVTSTNNISDHPLLCSYPKCVCCLCM